MNKIFITLFLIFTFQFGQAQIKVTSTPGTFDTLTSGTLIYYQYAWDDPLDEDYPVSLPLLKPLYAFQTLWDSMIVSDGSVYFTSTINYKALLIVDATGWDLIDKGWEDTINFPNISPITVSISGKEVEWMNFGFSNEIETLKVAPSNGSVKISVDTTNKVNLIFGDFSIVNPDLCFEGFGSLRPTVAYYDSMKGYTSWFIYGDPLSPTIDTLSDTAFANLPPLGQKLTLDFNKTNSIKRVAKINLSISPNPAKDILTINGLNNLNGSVFQVISMDGRTVAKGKMSSNEINIEQLKTGNYILKVNSKGQTYFARFIKADN